MSETVLAPYVHRVQYYETDMMGITHHANYIRWMEEARIDWMDRLGFPYAEMEKRGIFSPVRSVQCAYRRSTTFGDLVAVNVSVRSFNGVVMVIGYDMRRADTGETLCEAQSEHVFLNREGRFVRLKREWPAFCEAIERMMGEGKGGEP
ncbi:MAG: acyl-CoA thioesterase [Clostridia bacterium]|nr:acyl-CoA thioesterase [Clostridia bacterium]